MSQNLEVLDSLAGNEPRLQAAIGRLRKLLSLAVLPAAVEQMNYASYGDECDKIEAFFETCVEVGTKLDLDFTHQWDEIEYDVRKWSDSADDFWAHSNIPEQVLRFLKLLQEHQPGFLDSDRVTESLPAILADIRDRARYDCERA